MLLVAMAPAALLALARVVFLVLAVWGVHPFWLFEPLNLAEAAALRDRGEVARLLAQGENPNATYRIRRGFIRDYPVEMTPMAAALAARRDEIVQILLDAGATPLRDP
jgi:hypothetical protein